MDNRIIKEYSKGELQIVWEAKKCIHAAVCVETLPEVYLPEQKPWINPGLASIEELKNQIDLCPSGALSYYMKNENHTKNIKQMENIKAIVKPNGPMIIQGDFTITHADGRVEEIEKMAAICRCGASEKKPFCDGAHARVGFKG